MRAWWKVMAAYHRVYDSRQLQADCQEPRSAPGPYARQSSMGYLYLYFNRGSNAHFLCVTGVGGQRTTLLNSGVAMTSSSCALSCREDDDDIVPCWWRHHDDSSCFMSLNLKGKIALMMLRIITGFTDSLLCGTVVTLRIKSCCKSN